MDKEKALFESLLAEREEYRALVARLRKAAFTIREVTQEAATDPGELPTLAALLQRCEGMLAQAGQIAREFRARYDALIPLIKAAKTEVTADGNIDVYRHAIQDGSKALFQLRQKNA